MSTTEIVRVEANRKVLALAGDSHADVARLLGYTDRRNVWSWTNDLRPFPPQHCVTLVRAFPGEVSLQDLRPHDWQRYWPELAEPSSEEVK